MEVKKSDLKSKQVKYKLIAKKTHETFYRPTDEVNYVLDTNQYWKFLQKKLIK